MNKIIFLIAIFICVGCSRSTYEITINDGLAESHIKTLTLNSPPTNQILVIDKQSNRHIIKADYLHLHNLLIENIPDTSITLGVVDYTSFLIMNTKTNVKSMVNQDSELYQEIQALIDRLDFKP